MLSVGTDQGERLPIGGGRFGVSVEAAEELGARGRQQVSARQLAGGLKGLDERQSRGGKTTNEEPQMDTVSADLAGGDADSVRQEAPITTHRALTRGQGRVPRSPGIDRPRRGPLAQGADQGGAVRPEGRAHEGAAQRVR